MHITLITTVTQRVDRYIYLSCWSTSLSDYTHACAALYASTLPLILVPTTFLISVLSTYKTLITQSAYNNCPKLLNGLMICQQLPNVHRITVHVVHVLLRVCITFSFLRQLACTSCNSSHSDVCARCSLIELNLSIFRQQFAYLMLQLVTLQVLHVLLPV